MKRRIKSNPEWTADLVEQYCESIRAAAQKNNLPIPLLKDRCETYKELGSGAYSVVFNTDSPDCAFKIGTDSSEFHFAQTAINWRKTKNFDPEGMIDFRAVFSLPEQHDGLDVFIGWREKAISVGLPETIAKSDKSMIQFVTNLGKFYDAADAAFFLAHNELVASDGDMNHYWQWMDQRVGLANEMIDGNVAGGESDFADLLFKAYVACEEMEKSSDGKYIGSALREFFERGILIADIHANNVGIVDRGKCGQTWIISDPGHAAVLRKDLAKVEIRALEAL